MRSSGEDCPKPMAYTVNWINQCTTLVWLHHLVMTFYGSVGEWVNSTYVLSTQFPYDFIAHYHTTRINKISLVIAAFLVYLWILTGSEQACDPIIKL